MLADFLLEIHLPPQEAIAAIRTSWESLSDNPTDRRLLLFYLLEYRREAEPVLKSDWFKELILAYLSDYCDGRELFTEDEAMLFKDFWRAAWLVFSALQSAKLQEIFDWIAPTGRWAAVLALHEVLASGAVTGKPDPNFKVVTAVPAAVFEDSTAHPYLRFLALKVWWKLAPQFAFLKAIRAVRTKSDAAFDCAFKFLHETQEEFDFEKTKVLGYVFGEEQTKQKLTERISKLKRLTATAPAELLKIH